MDKDTCGRVLVIDDNTELLGLVGSLLEKNGIAADLAAGGEAGLQLLANSPESYRLVLLDIQMPDMDGFEILRRIRGDPLHGIRRLPVIAMSGNTHRIHAGGFDHFLPKPFRFDDLVALIRRTLAVEPKE